MCIRDRLSVIVKILGMKETTFECTPNTLNISVKFQRLTMLYTITNMFKIFRTNISNKIAIAIMRFLPKHNYFYFQEMMF